MTDPGRDEATAHARFTAGEKLTAAVDEAAVDSNTADEHRSVSGGSLEPRETVGTSEPAVLRQRLAVRALLFRGDDVLLARLSPLVLSAVGSWTLPGGGVDHGEHPDEALRREVFEETGLAIRDARVFAVYSRHFVGASPVGVLEDFHGIHLIYLAYPAQPEQEPRVTEVDGTTDAVAWVSRQDIMNGSVPVVEVVRFALEQAALV